jgi:hypothetical protein
VNRLTEQPLSPLEQFVRDYAEARDGAWDQLEPRVYDLLIGSEITRVAFDPEALPEHPQTQLASLGSPLLDGLLADAAERWRCARFYRIGLNLHPHGLESRFRQAVSLSPTAVVSIPRLREMNCPQALFWFKATFVGDQKEEEILLMGIDLHSLREVRHWDLLRTSSGLSELPEVHLPEARHAGLIEGYRCARDRLAPTVAALANTRGRERGGRVSTQIQRMSAYYSRLREEASEPLHNGDDAAASFRMVLRREAIDREERLRIAELRQKSALRVQVRLASLMIVQQPKLLMSVALTDKNRPLGQLEVVWNPLSEAIEAPSCPACGQPTFDLRICRHRLGCAACVTQAA